MRGNSRHYIAAAPRSRRRPSQAQRAESPHRARMISLNNHDCVFSVTHCTLPWHGARGGRHAVVHYTQTPIATDKTLWALSHLILVAWPLLLKSRFPSRCPSLLPLLDKHGAHREHRVRHTLTSLQLYYCPAHQRTCPTSPDARRLERVSNRLTSTRYCG